MNNKAVISKSIIKDSFWQYVRGICIICVVLIHSKNGIEFENKIIGSWNFDYFLVLRQLINFPVAIFIFLAGYFTNIEAAKRLEVTYFTKRGGRLLIPFLVWSTLYTLINIILETDAIIFMKTIAKLLLGLASAPLYYIVVLLQLVVITPYLIKSIQNKSNNLLLFLITPLYLLGLYFYTAVFKEQFLFYQTFFPAWFLFYYIGLRIKILGCKPLFKRQQLMYSIVFCAAALIISIIEVYGLLSIGFPIGFAISQIKASSFVYVLSLINLLIVVKSHFVKKELNWLKVVGDNSYGIYFIHMFWIMLSNKIMQFIPLVGDVLPAYQLVQIASVVISSLLSIFVTKKILGINLSSKLFGF